MYWDFSGNNGKGDWSTKGCILYNTTYNTDDSSLLDECHCTHLTYFSQVLMTNSKNISDKNQEANFAAITRVGYIASLVALTGVFLTAIIFPTWLKGPGQKIILQMSASLALLMTMFLIADVAPDNIESTGCLFLGLFLHYALLSNFFWMAIAGYLQYLRLVTVLYIRTPKLVLKTAVVGWGVPVIPGAVLLISGQFQEYSQPQRLCLPKDVTIIYLTIFTPLCVILLFNAIVFALIIKNLFFVFKSKPHVNRSVSVMRFKQLLFLFTLFGLNWMFGVFLIIFAEIPQIVTIAGYMFNISVAIQGLTYFVFFVLMHDALITRLKVYFYGKKDSSRQESSTNSFHLNENSSRK